MNTKHISLKTEKEIINSIDLIDNIVQATSHAFILERSKDLNLEIFNTQSQNFSDEENAKQLLQHLAELEGNTLKQFGTQYLNNLDAPIKTLFKQVPTFVKEIISNLEEMQSSLEKINKGEGSAEDWENLEDCPIDIQAEAKKANAPVEKLLQDKIRPFNEELLKKIKLACEIINCCQKDKDEKETESLESNTNTPQDNSYTKNYLDYQTNIDRLETGKLSLEKIQEGIHGIVSNFEKVAAYYTSFINKPGLLISRSDKAAQEALTYIRPLIAAMKNRLVDIENFTTNLK